MAITNLVPHLVAVCCAGIWIAFFVIGAMDIRKEKRELKELEEDYEKFIKDSPPISVEVEEKKRHLV